MICVCCYCWRCCWRWWCWCCCCWGGGGGGVVVVIVIIIIIIVVVINCIKPVLELSSLILNAVRQKMSESVSN